ncbi:MAG: hypothetical protein HKO66_10015 [Saprospiraceae bacterium]|nr:hypothetical protein [Saprospiraceae bacterium]
MCNSFIIEDVNERVKDTLLDELQGMGSDIEGNNPWKINLNRDGVVMTAAWQRGNDTLEVQVLEKNWYASCNRVEKAIRKTVDKLRDGIA